MSSIMIVLLLAFWAMPAQGTTGLSTSEFNYLATVNGYFDNLEQYLTNNKSHNYIQLRCVPVIIPSFPGRVVLFTEWASDGMVITLELSDLSVNSDGVVQLDVFNFTDTRKLKQGEYKVEDLYKLKPEDIKRPSTCAAEFEPDGPGMFVGSWPYCQEDIKGQPDFYSATITCKAIKEMIPRSAIETSSSIPYDLYLKGDKFKIPGIPDDFVNPCS